MRGIPPSSARPKRETQPAIYIPEQSRLLVLHGSAPSTEMVNFLDKVVSATSLAPTVVNVDKDCPGVSAFEAVSRLTSEAGSGAHFLLCIHGMVSAEHGEFFRQNMHAVSVSDARGGFVSTQHLLSWITADLASRVHRSSSADGVLPFIHLLSCHAGTLRQQLKPGSDLWRSAYFLIYSSKRETNVNACSTAITTAIRYADWCQRRRQAVDPLKLMFLAGVHRGDCMTLMGGDLREPLVWHAPKSEADLAEQRSLAMLQGDCGDVAWLHRMAAALEPAERALLPPLSTRELLSSRIGRDDLRAVAALLNAHPELRDQPSVLGIPPLIEAADVGANRCLALLLGLGADPNARLADGSGSALEMCANVRNIDGLRALLAAGADPNLADPDGFTPMMRAVEKDWKMGIQSLLDHGARMDLRFDGLTPLEAAVEDGCAEAVACLLSAGAGVNEGLTSTLVEFAELNGDHEIADMLELTLLPGRVPQASSGENES